MPLCPRRARAGVAPPPRSAPALSACPVRPAAGYRIERSLLHNSTSAARRTGSGSNAQRDELKHVSVVYSLTGALPEGTSYLIPWRSQVSQHTRDHAAHLQSPAAHPHVCTVPSFQYQIWFSKPDIPATTCKGAACQFLGMTRYISAPAPVSKQPVWAPAARRPSRGQCQRHPGLAAHMRARPPAPQCSAQPHAQHTLLLHLHGCCCARPSPGMHKVALPHPPQALQPRPCREQGLRRPGSCTALQHVQAAAAGRRAAHAPPPRDVPRFQAAAGTPRPRTLPAPVALLVHCRARPCHSACALGRRL